VETTSRKEALTVLRRLISYGEKIFCLSATLLAPLADGRLEPRRSTPAVVKATLVMFWTRLPSLNALAQISAPRFWKQWLHEPLPPGNWCAPPGSHRSGSRPVRTGVPRSSPLSFVLRARRKLGSPQHPVGNRPSHPICFRQIGRLSDTNLVRTRSSK
jgi:hypothetical protein